MTSVIRTDLLGKMSNIRATPQGGIEAPAFLARTGVLTYHNADGSTFKEFRDPAEVFSADALASFASAPVTIGHPGAVTPANWKANAVGHVRDDVRPDGQYMAANLVIQDAGALAKVQSGELVELSCGYTVDLDPTPGEYMGEKYDAKQTNIRGNHVALLPAGHGRAGKECALKMDSAVADYPLTIHMANETNNDAVTVLRDALAKAEKRADAAEGAGASEKARADKAEAALAKASDPSRLDAAVAARVALCDAARTIHGPKADVRFDGLSDRAIMEAALKVSLPDFKLDGRSDDFVRGVFEREAESAAKALRAGAAVQGAVPNGGNRSDAADPAKDPLAVAQAKQDAKVKTLWNKPVDSQYGITRSAN